MHVELPHSEGLTVVGAPLVKMVIDTWLKPKLEKLIKGAETKRQLIQNEFASSFEEYLSRSYQKQSYITTVVFQNQQQELGDVYVPLTLIRTRDHVKVKMDSWRTDFLPDQKRVLITDTAGMGKSTLARYLFLSCVQQNAGIPILIELRKLAGAKGIIDLVHSDRLRLIAS